MSAPGIVDYSDGAEQNGSKFKDHGLTVLAFFVEKFIRAQTKGLLYMRNNRGRAVASLARALKIKEAVAAQGFDDMRPALTEDGTINRDEQRKSIEYLLKPAGLKEAPSLDKIYDFFITRRVYQKLQSRGWKPAE